jgi:DNA-binding transcriptional MerR regulator
MRVENDSFLSLAELARQADVTPRTVRYYIVQGLLPGPDGQGGGARYNSSHLDRIRLIKRLQQTHLPLADIRSRVSGLDDDQVSVLLAEPEAPPPPAQGERALAYIRSLLVQSPSAAREPQPNLGLVASVSGPAAAPSAPAPAVTSSSKPSTTERSTWERISLAPDIELHVRRPLDRQSNKDLEQLLALARELFKRP